MLAGRNSYEKSDSTESRNNNTGFAVSIGKEYRLNITNNFELRLGGDLSFQYTQTENEMEDKTIHDSDRYRKSAPY